LVTSQDNAISCYQLSGSGDGVTLLSCTQPGWDGSSLHLHHPHRFYQHLTQFRATWHPRSEDIFIIGRWPDKTAEGEEAQRGIDVFDIEFGSWVARLGTDWPGLQAGGPAIRADGEAVAAMSGHTAIVYTQEEDEDLGRSTPKTLILPCKPPNTKTPSKRRAAQTSAPQPLGSSALWPLSPQGALGFSCRDTLHGGTPKPLNPKSLNPQPSTPNPSPKPRFRV